MRSTLITPALVSGLLCACGAKDITQKPPSSAVTPTFETRPSTVAALATIPIAEVSSLVNSKVPTSFNKQGTGDDVCVEWRIGPYVDRACAGTRYQFSATRTGGITVTPAENSGLTLSLPVSFSGNGGFRGDVASAIKANAKNFNGALVVDAHLRPTVSEDWCPGLKASMSYRWTSDPRIEIVDGIWVNVRGQVEKELEKKIPELLAGLDKAVDCTKFRHEIGMMYGTRSLPVSIPEVGLLHINVKPIDIGFSGLIVEPTLIKATALLTANVEVATAPLVAENIPLPKLKRIPATPPQMSLNMPFRLSYAHLTEVVSRAMVGKTFEQDTPAGNVAVTIKAVDIYPSNGKLVVGLNIDADLPASILDTRGYVYLLAAPGIKDGTKLVLDETSYSQTLDNAFWSTAAILFEGQIRSAISRASTYDFEPDIAKAKTLLSERLNDPTVTGDWAVGLDRVEMTAGRIAVADKELAVEGIFSAAATIAPRH